MVNFSKDAYTGELVALGEIVQQVQDPELKAAIIIHVNRMQEILRPIVDSYLGDLRGSDQEIMTELYGPNGLG